LASTRARFHREGCSCERLDDGIREISTEPIPFFCGRHLSSHLGEPDVRDDSSRLLGDAVQSGAVVEVGEGPSEILLGPGLLCDVSEGSEYAEDVACWV
jgi:hypothetical protein